MCVCVCVCVCVLRIHGFSFMKYLWILEWVFQNNYNCFV